MRFLLVLFIFPVVAFGDCSFFEYHMGNCRSESCNSYIEKSIGNKAVSMCSKIFKKDILNLWYLDHYSVSIISQSLVGNTAIMTSNEIKIMVRE